MTSGERAITVVLVLMPFIGGKFGREALGALSEGMSKLNFSRETELLLDIMPEFTGTMRERLLASIQDTKLKEIANQLYRKGATIGDGGTAAALYDEFYKGTSTHLIKAKEKLTGLTN